MFLVVFFFFLSSKLVYPGMYLSWFLRQWSLVVVPSLLVCWESEQEHSALAAACNSAEPSLQEPHWVAVEIQGALWQTQEPSPETAIQLSWTSLDFPYAPNFYSRKNMPHISQL